MYNSKDVTIKVDDKVLIPYECKPKSFLEVNIDNKILTLQLDNYVVYYNILSDDRLSDILKSDEISIEIDGRTLKSKNRKLTSNTVLYILSDVID